MENFFYLTRYNIFTKFIDCPRQKYNLPKNFTDLQILLVLTNINILYIVVARVIGLNLVALVATAGALSMRIEV